MKLHLTTTFFALLATSGCERKPNVDSAPNDEPVDEPRTAMVVEERTPVFQAEIFLESRSPDKGIVRYSGGLVSSYRTEIRKEGNGNPPLSSKRWESEKTEMEFNLLDGSVCRITPTYIGHRDGFDDWGIELDYVASGESNGSQRARALKKISFDGKSPAMVTEDKYHSILVRPGTKTVSEQGAASKP